MIKLKQLTYLESLARHRHFGRAANECSISQPALSVQISQLEARLGVILFERGRNGAIITPDGIEVVQRAREILEKVSDLSDYANSSAGMAGPLRIGIIPTITPYILPAMLKMVQDQYPALEPQIRESRTEQLVEELCSGNLDLIIAALPINNRLIAMEGLFDDPFVLAVPENRPTPQHHSELLHFIRAEHLLLLEEGHCLRDQALQHCDVAGIQYGKIYGTSNITTLVQMVANGMGITILPRMCLSLELRDAAIKLVPFQKPVPYRRVGIGWRLSTPNIRRMEVMRDIVKTVSKQFTDC